MLFTADLDNEPNPALTRGDCVGCHAQNPSGANIVTDIPQVRHDGDDLAAGNFNYVVGGTAAADAKGHNVSGITTSDDGILDSTPPGYVSAYDPATTDFDTGNRLVCAGQNGCHGNRNQSDQFAAISGGHHGDDSCLKFGSIVEGSQGASVATSYRFLYNIHGGEDADWQNASVSKHNEYKGAAFATRTGLTYDSNVDTISELCAECHGIYHYSTGIGTATPWLRHPTDRVLPDSGEYSEYNTPNTGATQYSLTAPLARQDIPLDDSSGSITLNSDVIMCLSCHGAHATNFYKLMRWDNKANMDGCVVCHTSKN